MSRRRASGRTAHVRENGRQGNQNGHHPVDGLDGCTWMIEKEQIGCRVMVRSMILMGRVTQGPSLKARTVHYLLTPLLQDSPIDGQARVAKTNTAPHGLLIPIAIDVRPHLNVAVGNQMEDGLKPIVPRIVKGIDTTKGCRLGNHDGFVVGGGKIQ